MIGSEKMPIKWMINWHFFQRIFLLKFVLFQTKANKDDYCSDSEHLFCKFFSKQFIVICL